MHEYLTCLNDVRRAVQTRAALMPLQHAILSWTRGKSVRVQGYTCGVLQQLTGTCNFAPMPLQRAIRS